MKRVFLFLCISTLLCTKLFADNITATLQKGDSIKVFYGYNAFTQAYDAASDGDTITLSPGCFYSVADIKKSVTIIGSNAFSSNDSERTQFSNSSITISTNNVHIEGVFFTNYVNLDTIRDCVIRKCRMATIYASGDHTNTIIDQCLIGTDCAIHKGINYCLKNSTIKAFGGTPNSITDTIHSAYVTNCYVLFWFNDNNSDDSPKAIYKNNVLGLNSGKNYQNKYGSLSLHARSEYYNNFFQKWRTDTQVASRYSVIYAFSAGCLNSGNSDPGYSKYTVISSEKTLTAMDTTSYSMLGQDGTPVGITGGTGFSEYPSIPRVTSKNIDANTDAEGKINVQITVKAE